MEGLQMQPGQEIRSGVGGRVSSEGMQVTFRNCRATTLMAGGGGGGWSPHLLIQQQFLYSPKPPVHTELPVIQHRNTLKVKSTYA